MLSKDVHLETPVMSDVRDEMNIVRVVGLCLGGLDEALGGV
jgi:hypothetical protein